MPNLKKIIMASFRAQTTAKSISESRQGSCASSRGASPSQEMPLRKFIGTASSPNALKDPTITVIMPLGIWDCVTQLSIIV